MVKKAKSNLNGSLQKHEMKTTEYRQEFVDLPPGIQGGIATLIDAKIGVYKTGNNIGEQHVYLAGSVVEPSEVTFVPCVFEDGTIKNLPAKTMNVVGQRTSVLLPLCETTNKQGEVTSIAENIDLMFNELQKLGADPSHIPESQDAEKELEELLAAMAKEGLVFKFGTSASKLTAANPNPRVWENWYGNENLEDYEAPEVGEVEDNTNEPEEEPKDESEEEAAEESADFEEGDGELADAGDEEAQGRLTITADAKGLDTNDYETWSEVESLLSGEEGSKEAEEEAVEEMDPPEKEDVFLYKPPRKRKAIPCVVKAVFVGKKTCNLMNLADKTSYKGVLWDKLEENE